MSKPNVLRKHHGSALVIGMILMLVLTMLGIAGLGMARNALYMASTEQIMARTFRAAESAIEERIALDDFNPGVATTTTVTSPELNGVSATHVQRFLVQTDSNVYGGSKGKFTAFNFEVNATATADRGSQIELVQGVYRTAKK